MHGTNTPSLVSNLLAPGGLYYYRRTSASCRSLPEGTNLEAKGPFYLVRTAEGYHVGSHPALNRKALNSVSRNGRTYLGVNSLKGVFLVAWQRKLRRNNRTMIRTVSKCKCRSIETHLSCSHSEVKRGETSECCRNRSREEATGPKLLFSTVLYIKRRVYGTHYSS
jgi:hypothetical protein